MKYLQSLILFFSLLSCANADESIFDNLNSILADKPQITHLMLSEHIAKYKYESWIDDKGFATYLSYDNSTDDPSPGPSVILFLTNSQLYAVLHTGEIDKSHFKEIDIVSGYHVGYFSGEKNIIKSNFKNKYYEIIRNAD